MSNLLSLLRNARAHKFNNKQKTHSHGSKTSKHKRFIWEYLEPRVLPAVDPAAIAALMGPPDTGDTAIVTATEHHYIDLDEASGTGFQDPETFGGRRIAQGFINYAGYEEVYGEFNYEQFLVIEEEEGPQGGPGGIVEEDAFAFDALANNNAGATGTSQFTQSETTVIAFGNTVLIGFNDSGSLAGGTNKFTGFSRSTDGGVTFVDGGVLPTNPGGDFGDPVLARNDTTGRVYFSTLGGGTAGTIQMFRSDDGGATWMLPVNATPGGNGEDKQWHTVDNIAGPGNGNVYMVSRRFGGTATGIYFFRSTDHGDTFGPTGGLLIAAATQPVQGAFVTVGTDHSVYVFWLQGTGTAQTIQMRKSTDQGQTFGAPVTVVSGVTGGGNGDLALTGIRQGTATASLFRSNAFPHAAVNPVNGNIYVTYNSDGPGADRGDVFVVQSVDGGVTWGAPIKVNDDVTTTDQFQPTLAVTPEGDKLGIFYTSRQEDPANNLFKYYGRIADISGSTLTFTPSFAISDTASLPEFGRDTPVNPTYMGDYNTASATTGFFHVVWSDNRDDLPGGAGRKDPNVYYKAIDLGLTVRSTSPLNGAVVSTIPLDYVVNFSDPIQAATVDASDFTVDGVAANSFTINSPTQVTFRYLTAPFSVNGLHTMAMAADSILRSSDGDTLAAFSGSFRWDSLLLQVTSVVPPTGGTFFLPAPFTYDVNFNEAISPTSVQTWDLVVGGIVGATVSAVTVLPGNTTARFTIAGLVDQGTLTANIMAGAIADAFGNPGGAFSAIYQVDVVTASYPTPLINKTPLGSLIYDPTQNGVISFAGDVDNYTLSVDPNQTFSVILTTTTTTFQPQIEIRDPSNALRGFASAPAAGQAAIIQTNYALVGGVYNFAVSGAGNTLGAFTLQVILNSALELEGRLPSAVNNGLINVMETAVNAVDSGWIELAGFHSATNNSYQVGSPATGVFFRNYTTFTLSSWTPTILSAELRIFNPATGYSSPDPTETYTLFDVSATAAALDTTRPAGDPTGMAIFDDLGSGTIYGTRTVSSADNNTSVSIPLNAAAVAALNAAIGSTISFGGAITTLGPAVQTMFNGSTGALGQVQLILRSMGPTQSIDSSFITLSTPQASAERLAVLGQAEAGNFIATPVAATFEDISTTGTLIAFLTNQDNAAASIQIPFAFPFYGVSNTTVIVGSNGLLNFVLPQLAPANTDLTTIPTNATIAPFWDDLHTGGGLPNSNVYFQTLGTGNNQHLTVQWNNVRFATGGVAGDTITFQVQLYADGRIQFNYLDLVSGTAPGNDGASATVGVKAAGTQGPSRLLLAFNNGPNAFVGTGQSTLLTVTPPTSDYYSLALDAGEIVTLAATGQTPGNLNLQLRDSSDNVLATGVSSSNLTSVISNFAVPTGGIYYARITGDGASLPYSLVVTKNAAFDTEDNSAAITAQTLITEGALGSISGAATIIASDTGWIATDGTHMAANSNYIVGQATFNGDPLSTFRDYFTFSLPTTGTIIGAELRIINPTGGYISPDPTETYTLFDVSATPAALDAERAAGNLTGMAIHADLGSGTVYGTRVFSSADNNTTVAITLNAAALSAINAAIGSTISFGGAITSLAGTSQQTVFAFSGAPGAVQLVLQLARDDWYSITLPGTANALRLETSTPGDGPGEFANTLNPIIELYDSSGTTLIASGVAMADGRNEFILATGLTPGGTYKVRVNGQGGTTGEYFLTRTFSSMATIVDLGWPTVEEDTTWSSALNDPVILEGWNSDVDSYAVAVKKLRPFLDDIFYDDVDKEAGITGDDWFFVTDTLDERY
jgi:hypothetical protein